MSANSNRRRHPRVEAKDVTSHLKHEGQSQLALGVENISLGGLLLRTNQPLNLGAQVWLELTRPGTKPLQLVGRVVGVNPLPRPGPRRGTHGLSVRFNPMGDAAQERLRELVQGLSWVPLPSPVAPPTPVRQALGETAPLVRRSADFDYDRPLGLAGDDLSEAVVGQAASSGAKFELDGRLDAFDFNFQEPLSAAVMEPSPVAVPASAQLKAEVRSREATPEELREMLAERDRELEALRELLAKKNEHIEKLRRAVLELRHRDKPVL